MRDRVRAVLENGPLLTVIVVLTTFAFHALYLVPATRRLAVWLMVEDSVVQDISFVALIAAAVLGVVMAVLLRRSDQPRLVWGFFLVFAFGVFVVAMEEISWGQWLFFFKTPHAWRSLNRQGETNLHDLPGLWGRSEWLRLLFAGGGLIGVWANRRPALRAIATPPSFAGWFAFMTAYVAVDAVNDFTRDSWLLNTFNPISEWLEMLIGLSALAYIWLKRDEQARSRAPNAHRSRGDATDRILTS